MNLVAVRNTAIGGHECPHRHQIDIEGPGTIEVDGQLLPRWFRTRDGRYWEAESVCALSNRGAAAGEASAVAPGILYRPLSQRELTGRWLMLARAAAGLAVMAWLILGMSL